MTPGTGRSRELLAASEACAAEGRRLIDDAIRLRREAYDELPTEVTLRMVFPLPDGAEFTIRRWADGVWRNTEGIADEYDWVLEQWERGNWEVIG